MDQLLNNYKSHIALIKEQYPFLKEAMDGTVLSYFNEIQNEQIIKEFLYTVDPNKVFDLLDFGDKINKQLLIAKNSKFISITVKVPLKDILSQLEEKMNTLGYYISEISKKLSPFDKPYTPKEMPKSWLDDRNINLLFEPKYDMEIIPGGNLYHVTPEFNLKKIKLFGLTPKSQSKISYHPERIYLVDKLNSDTDEVDYALTLWEKSYLKDYTENMILLEIHLDKLKDIHFFEDPKFFIGNAVWTYQNIPPNAITIKKKILVNPHADDIENYRKKNIK